MENPTVKQIMNEDKVSEQVARNMKMNNLQRPKVRRCEMCLSHAEFTLPISMELCEHCYQVLLTRREKVYTLSAGATMTSFRCDMCSRKSYERYEINPIACVKCVNKFYTHIHNIKKLEAADRKKHLEKQKAYIIQRK